MSNIECKGCLPKEAGGGHFWDCPAGIALKVDEAHQRGIAEGVRQERSRVVAWLRQCGVTFRVPKYVADDIERGEHAKVVEFSPGHTQPEKEGK